MKSLFFSALIVSSSVPVAALANVANVSATADCQLVRELKGQKHFQCALPGTQKKLEVLDLKGDFVKTAYYHGLFLRHQIEEGVYHGIHLKSERAFASIPEKDRKTFESLKHCIIDRYRASSSPEFIDGLRELHRGLRDAGSRIERDKFIEMNYMVEFSIFADSLQRKMALNPGQAKREVIALCGPRMAIESLAGSIGKLVEGLKGLKMGCTGVATSAAHSRDGAPALGRNFDTGLLGYFEKHPTVVIQNHRGHRTVGLASAGLHYAGGISGFNNHGLVASLHELQTEATRAVQAPGSSHVAPYLLHKVLSQAKTLDQAIHMIKQSKGFGAWTIFIGDSKTDELASIEISGDHVVVARQSQKTFLGQSNHFISPVTQRFGYEYSLNKTLESRGRLAHVTSQLEQNSRAVDANWIIDMLSGHHDVYVGTRSFGRTTTKLYTASTHVMVPSRQEFWTSHGDLYPTNRNTFFGFRVVDGDVPLQLVGTHQVVENLAAPAWYDSLAYYINAWASNESDRETLKGVEVTLGHVQKARDLATQAGRLEFPYEFMWARLKIHQAALFVAAKDSASARSAVREAQAVFNTLVAQPGLHAYELAQSQMWWVRGEELLELTGLRLAAETSARKEFVRVELKKLLDQYPKQQELKDLLVDLNSKANVKSILKAGIRFGTVE